MVGSTQIEYLFGTLRVKAGCDCGTRVAIGTSGVEEYSVLAAGERTEAEAEPFASLDQVVDRFGGPVGDESVVPIGDFVEPADQGDPYQHV